MEAALEAHFTPHPHARPSPAQVALALASQDGSELADRPELIERDASQVLARHPDADADDVLLWAEAQLAASCGDRAGHRAGHRPPVRCACPTDLP